MWDTLAVPGLLGINEGTCIVAPAWAAIVCGSKSGPYPAVLSAYLDKNRPLDSTDNSERGRTSRALLFVLRPRAGRPLN